MSATQHAADTLTVLTDPAQPICTTPQLFRMWAAIVRFWKNEKLENPLSSTNDLRPIIFRFYTPGSLEASNPSMYVTWLRRDGLLNDLHRGSSHSSVEPVVNRMIEVSGAVVFTPDQLDRLTVDELFADEMLGGTSDKEVAVQDTVPAPAPASLEEPGSVCPEHIFAREAPVYVTPNTAETYEAFMTFAREHGYRPVTKRECYELIRGVTPGIQHIASKVRRMEQHGFLLFLAGKSRAVGADRMVLFRRYTTSKSDGAEVITPPECAMVLPNTSESPRVEPLAPVVLPRDATPQAMTVPYRDLYARLMKLAREKQYHPLSFDEICSEIRAAMTDVSRPSSIVSRMKKYGFLQGENTGINGRHGGSPRVVGFGPYRASKASDAEVIYPPEFLTAYPSEDHELTDVSTEEQRGTEDQPADALVLSADTTPVELSESGIVLYEYLLTLDEEETHIYQWSDLKRIVGEVLPDLRSQGSIIDRLGRAEVLVQVGIDPNKKKKTRLLSVVKRPYKRTGSREVQIPSACRPGDAQPTASLLEKPPADTPPVRTAQLPSATLPTRQSIEEELARVEAEIALSEEAQSAYEAEGDRLVREIGEVDLSLMELREQLKHLETNRAELQRQSEAWQASEPPCAPELRERHALLKRALEGVEAMERLGLAQA